MSSLGVANRKEGRHLRIWSNYVYAQINISQDVCIEAKKKQLLGSYESLWVVSSPRFQSGLFFLTNPQKKNILRLLVLLMIKGFGSHSGGLCIHRALMLQDAAVPYIILSMRETYINTHTLDIYLGAELPGILGPISAYQGEKQEKFHLAFYGDWC